MKKVVITSLVAGIAFISAGALLSLPEGVARAADSAAGAQDGVPADWTALDMNGDGYARKDEVAKAGPGIDFKSADSNDDGNLSRVEFLDMQQSVAKNTSDSGGGADTADTKLPDDWTALDLNEDGYAKADEVTQVAPGIDFKAADSNGDGELSRVEFLNLQEAANAPASKTASADGHGGKKDVPAAQSKYKSAYKLVENTPKGNLENPYANANSAQLDEGHEAFMNAGCNGCHGGTGGGGMCPPLSNVVWVYGDKPDTLFRLITIGSQELQSNGYSRIAHENVVGYMPPMHTVIDDPDQIWKMVSWALSLSKNK